MQDIKNAFLATASSLSPIFAAIETGTLDSIISAIGLPLLLFAAGKTLDIILQLYLARRAERNRRRWE
ncbi:MAG TPA: hypothetical protein DEA22_09115 [Blastocatellia bacterium]|nr:hypothetical protein [Blastocatellia bacterium]